MFITDDFGNQVYLGEPPPEDMANLGVRVMRMEGELLVGASRMTRIEAAAEQTRTDLETNTAMTKDVLDSLADVVEFFTAMKGAFKVLNWMGAVAKPVAAVVGLATAIMVAYSAWSSTK